MDPPCLVEGFANIRDKLKENAKLAVEEEATSPLKKMEEDDQYIKRPGGKYRTVTRS